jgi:hypothetical protein
MKIFHIEFNVCFDANLGIFVGARDVKRGSLDFLCRKGVAMDKYCLAEFAK